MRGAPQPEFEEVLAPLGQAAETHAVGSSAARGPHGLENGFLLFGERDNARDFEHSLCIAQVDFVHSTQLQQGAFSGELRLPQAILELGTMYKVYLRDAKRVFKISRGVALTKKQETILKTIDPKLLALEN